MSPLEIDDPYEKRQKKLAEIEKFRKILQEYVHTKISRRCHVEVKEGTEADGYSIIRRSIKKNGYSRKQ